MSSYRIGSSFATPYRNTNNINTGRAALQETATHRNTILHDSTAYFDENNSSGIRHSGKRLNMVE